MNWRHVESIVVPVPHSTNLVLVVPARTKIKNARANGVAKSGYVVMNRSKRFAQNARTFPAASIIRS
jgi:hypothetical protein